MRIVLVPVLNSVMFKRNVYTLILNKSFPFSLLGYIVRLHRYIVRNESNDNYTSKLIEVPVHVAS